MVVNQPTLDCVDEAICEIDDLPEELWVSGARQAFYNGLYIRDPSRRFTWKKSSELGQIKLQRAQAYSVGTHCFSWCNEWALSTHRLGHVPYRLFESDTPIGRWHDLDDIPCPLGPRVAAANPILEAVGKEGWEW